MSASSLSSLVIVVFDTMPRSRAICGLFSARHRYRRLSLTCSTRCRARERCVVCVATSSLSSIVVDEFDNLPHWQYDVWSVLARHRYRRVSLSCSTPRRFRARYVVCLSTSSPLSLVIDGFDTLPRSMRGLDSHVIAIIAWYCPVASPVITTIAVDIVHTNYPRIRPAIAPDVWSVLPRYRYRRLSLTGSTPCHAGARRVVRVSA